MWETKEDEDWSGHEYAWAGYKVKKVNKRFWGLFTDGVLSAVFGSAKDAKVSGELTANITKLLGN